MKSRIVSLFLAFIVSLCVTTPVFAAPNGGSAASEACKNEGYLNYTDAEGNPFKNQGQCVRYATQGGELKAYEEEIDPWLSVSWSVVEPGQTFTGVLTGAGLAPGAVVYAIAIPSLAGDMDYHLFPSEWFIPVGTVTENGEVYVELPLNECQTQLGDVGFLSVDTSGVEVINMFRRDISPNEAIPC